MKNEFIVLQPGLYSLLYLDAGEGGRCHRFFFFPTDNKLLTEISTVTTIVKKKSNDLNVLL